MILPQNHYGTLSGDRSIRGRAVRRTPLIAAVYFVVLLVTVQVRAAADEIADPVVFFETKIRPILRNHCYECHSGQSNTAEGGLRLDTREGIRAGGDTAAAVVPGDVKASLLVRAISYQDLEMPPDQKLSDDVIADFEKWILMGAPDPREGPAAEHDETDYERAREYWAFQPIQAPPLPTIENESWPQTAIDHFIVARLAEQGLSPASPSDRSTLIRRLHFDLVGLPPSIDQIANFVNDKSPDAETRLVDRLLASPHYGERWGQHWLDVVRFAETEGFEYDRLMPGAWRYRDYVVQSFNEDKPYDRFLTEQVAGDELNSRDRTLRVAAGFHRLGSVRRNAGNQKVASSRNEVLTERTDIIGTVFLGLTIGCARCHDHKFDPIPQRDYYRLQAFLAGTHEDNIIIATESEQRRWKEKTERIEKKLTALKESLSEELDDTEESRVRREIEQLEYTLPPPLATLCSIKNDPDNLTPIHLLRRGDADQPGPRLGIRAIGVLLPDEIGELPPETVRPRTLLAQWLTATANSLTARVMVNRIWQHHFRNGIVSTTNDFGANGSLPTHPQLLDYLARRFLAGGWRLKRIEREILLSSTYRQSVEGPDTDRRRLRDPENFYLSHFSRRRLSAEEIRDAMLAVSGQLQRRMGGPSVMLPVDDELIQQLYKPTQWQVTPDRAEHARRSIYLIAKRNLRLPFMEVFDQPSAQTSCAVRQQSTHAPQSLELLNGRIANELAEAFADRIRREAGRDKRRQIARSFQLVTGRQPTKREFELANEFLQDASLREFALAMFNLNAFLYVD